MKLSMAKTLHKIGNIMGVLIPYDITCLSILLYKHIMLYSIKLDTNRVIWKNPQDARTSIMMRMKL